MAEYEVKQLKVSKDGNVYNINTGENYAFDGTYDAQTNKVATVSTVTNAINDLGTIGDAAAKGVDTSIAPSSVSTNLPTSAAVANLIATLDGLLTGSPGVNKTISAFSQTDGKVSVTFSDISIVKSQISDLGTIGDAAAKGVDTSIAPSSVSTNLPTSAAVASFVANNSAKSLLMPTNPINIPDAGTSDIYTMQGLTSNHRVVLWNFSDSPENIVPVSLTIITATNQFTVTNNGGVTSETIQPVFSIPDTVSCTKQ